MVYLNADYLYEMISFRTFFQLNRIMSRREPFIPKISKTLWSSKIYFSRFICVERQKMDRSLNSETNKKLSVVSTRLTDFTDWGCRFLFLSYCHALKDKCEFELFRETKISFMIEFLSLILQYWKKYLFFFPLWLITSRNLTNLDLLLWCVSLWSFYGGKYCNSTKIQSTFYITLNNRFI